MEAQVPPFARDILTDDAVIEGLRQAWLDSHPGISGGHEEGGFIVKEPDRRHTVLRWPRGVQDEIEVPVHTDCQIQGKRIIATFHTHPNTGHDYLQEPSEDDTEAVRHDPDLKSDLYLGEFVISDKIIYLVSQIGRISELGLTAILLAFAREGI